MYQYAAAIGIDIGRTGIRYGIVRYDGLVMYNGRIQYPRKRNTAVVIDRLTKILGDTQRYASAKGINPLCIGIGSPGFVDLQTGVVLGAALHIRDWKNIPLGALMAEKAGIPAFIDNDATLYGYAEWMYGAAKNRENVLFVSLRTGIGGAIVVNGKLYRGAHNSAGELGQMTINYKGMKNKWGGRGSLESYAGATTLVRYYNTLVKKQGQPEMVVTTAKPIFERYHRGDLLAKDAITQNAYFLGVGLGSLVNIFSPELIVLGGGMALGGEDYILKIQTVMKEHALENCINGLQIIPAQLKEKAGFIGAARYALERLDGKIP